MAVKLKSPTQIEAMKEAGRVSALALRRVGEAVEPGITTAELDAIAEKVIRAEGGVPAFKGYGGFPGSICASVNDAVVHGIPSRKLVLREGDLISIDTGAIVDGWVGDNAWTYPVGTVAPRGAAPAGGGGARMWEGLCQRASHQAPSATSGPRGAVAGRGGRATRWCATTWATASDARCTRIRTSRTSGVAARG